MVVETRDRIIRVVRRNLARNDDFPRLPIFPIRKIDLIQIECEPVALSSGVPSHQEKVKLQILSWDHKSCVFLATGAALLQRV
jgi:hypothetical protein